MELLNKTRVGGGLGSQSKAEWRRASCGAWRQRQGDSGVAVGLTVSRPAWGSGRTLMEVTRALGAEVVEHVWPLGAGPTAGHAACPCGTASGRGAGPAPAEARGHAHPTAAQAAATGPELAPRCLTLLVSDALPAQERFHN